MLVVIFMRNPTDRAALIFYQVLSSTINRKLCACISRNAENRIESTRSMLLLSFQERSVNNTKVLATFYKKLSFGYCEIVSDSCKS